MKYTRMIESATVPVNWEFQYENLPKANEWQAMARLENSRQLKAFNTLWLTSATIPLPTKFYLKETIPATHTSHKILRYGHIGQEYDDKLFREVGPTLVFRVDIENDSLYRAHMVMIKLSFMSGEIYLEERVSAFEDCFAWQLKKILRSLTMRDNMATRHQDIQLVRGNDVLVLGSKVWEALELPRVRRRLNTKTDVKQQCIDIF